MVPCDMKLDVRRYLRIGRGGKAVALSADQRHAATTSVTPRHAASENRNSLQLLTTCTAQQIYDTIAEPLGAVQKACDAHFDQLNAAEETVFGISTLLAGKVLGLNALTALFTRLRS